MVPFEEYADAAKIAIDEYYAEISFIEDPFAEIPGENVTKDLVPSLYEGGDLVIECATADVLKKHLEISLKNADLLMFSVAAFLRC